MLGWSFNVTDETGAQLGYWSSSAWDADKWIMDGLKTGQTEVIQLSGGYPNIYRVRASILPLDKLMREAVTSWCRVEVWDQS